MSRLSYLWFDTKAERDERMRSFNANPVCYTAVPIDPKYQQDDPPEWGIQLTTWDLD